MEADRNADHASRHRRVRSQSGCTGLRRVPEGSRVHGFPQQAIGAGGATPGAGQRHPRLAGAAELRVLRRSDPVRAAGRSVGRGPQHRHFVDPRSHRHRRAGPALEHRGPPWSARPVVALSIAGGCRTMGRVAAGRRAAADAGRHRLHRREPARRHTKAQHPDRKSRHRTCDRSPARRPRVLAAQYRDRSADPGRRPPDHIAGEPRDQRKATRQLGHGAEARHLHREAAQCAWLAGQRRSDGEVLTCGNGFAIRA